LGEHAAALTDGMAAARRALGFGAEDLAGPVERIARPQHARDALLVLGPLLDLAEVAVVGPACTM
jgi:hypothetical protein